MTDPDRWVEAGLISEEQAESIRQFEETGVAQPAEEAGSLRAVLAEIAGYLGAALIVSTVAALFQDLWRDLSPWFQLGLVAALTVVVSVAGMSLRDSQEPALKRLAAVLLALTPGGVAWALALFGQSVFDRDEQAFIPVMLFIAAGVATYLYRVFPHFFTHVSMFVLWFSFVTAVPDSYNSIDSRLFWIGMLALGLAWVLLAEAEVVVPQQLGQVLGTGAALIGAGASSEYGWESYAMGLPVAALIVAFGVFRQKPLLVGLGAAGFFVFLAMLLLSELNESLALLVLLVIGVLLVVGVWAWARRNRSTTPFTGTTAGPTSDEGEAG